MSQGEALGRLESATARASQPLVVTARRDRIGADRIGADRIGMRARSANDRRGIETRRAFDARKSQ
ncbi:hypothetical protein ISG08_23555 [Burkholderia pseudomallei]|uniref:hypothetical protein n=1 Tax=Burkholderia pseudomallei TaxID=28450 RepID=UPI00016B060C|nr:hypothetical protein [Burkholderia pseudomallei]AJX40222.1 hypothetical protein DP45_04517 [Burkholderia pseudomallei]MBF3805999.1 hypothetical protein [Burkholderia pseudomallei]MCD4523175.1 hypothetical protein [Burkholderia pseudomallei]MCW0132636.1 hypothetical protein [Burkholderia pseudomallei]OMS93610.1 hypothetical protein AQ749_27770 [Burkholderia pseudomallei]